VPRAPASEDRRVRRTLRAIEDSFVTLVLERGYDKVSVEDIAAQADIARATFYAHFAHKEDLLRAVFTAMLDDLSARLTFEDGPWSEVRPDLVTIMFRHADEYRDIYRVCLCGAAEGQARRAYMDLVAEAGRRNFEDRVAALGTTPQAPIPIQARFAAGAHVALLESWLSDEIALSAEEMAVLELDLLVGGLARSHGLQAGQVRFPSAG